MKNAYSKASAQICFFEPIDIVCASGPIEGEPQPFDDVNEAEIYASPAAEVLIAQAKLDSSA